MKRYFIPALIASLMTLSLRAQPIDFHDHIGLQLWSLRAQFPKNPSGSMDLVNTYGITEIETAGTAGLPVGAFNKMLVDHHLKPVGAHISYEQCAKDLKGVITNMKALGVTYVTIPVIAHPHSKFLTTKQAHEAAANLNKWGEVLKSEGLQLGVHTHGFEFTPLPDSNNETVGLLKKYPDRWLMLHIKDLRIGADREDGVPAHTKTGDDVAVGTGVIDWKAVLSAAQEDGVKYYFIEDETTDALKNIPLSVAYLKALKL